jgi:hypothetical protein
MMNALVSPFGTLAAQGDFASRAAESGFLQAAKEFAAEGAASRSATMPTLVFDLFVALAAVVVFLMLRRSIDKVWTRVGVMAAGVLLFELFTAPMWINEHLGRWAYLYLDLSWILTLGWTTMILGVVVLVDRKLPHWNELKRFAACLGILLVLVTLAEALVVGIGIRRYAPEVLETVSGISLFGVPVEILYYVPVFTGLVIAFYKYWCFLIDDAVLVPVRRRHWVRGILLAFLGIFLFEIVVEPMVRNENLPAWSYVYRDISFLMTGAWVLLFALAGVALDRVLLAAPAPLRFAAALVLIGILALPLESWLIMHGYRVYGESATANFTGFVMPVTGVATEVAFAIPCYVALIVGFIRYWEIVLDNKL